MARLPHPLRLAAVALAALALTGVAANAYAWSAWRASFDGVAPLATRLAAAERAHAVEPWNAAFTVRELRLRAQSFAARNQPANAYAALRRAIELAPDDPELRAELKRAYAAYYQATTWKAHVQHGREQTGGVLPEKDVVR